MKNKEQYKKDIHHIHDKSYKDLYSKKEIAIDLFKSLLNEEWTKYLTKENLTLVNKSFVTSDYEETEADIVYKANIGEKEVYFYILLEFQSTVDYRMPLRLLFYMCEILREHAVNTDYRKRDKNIKVPAVIPIVLYNGEERWNVPNEFRKIIYNENLFGNGLLNFKYDVFDIGNDEEFSKEKLIKNRNVTSAIFLLDQKMNALEFFERIKVIALYFDGLTDTERKAIKNWIKNTMVDELAESAIDILNAKKENVEIMVARNTFILQEMEEEAILKGMQKGMEKGMQKGMQKGMEKGREEEKVEIAKNLLDILNDDVISLKTGLDVEVVRRLRAEK